LEGRERESRKVLNYHAEKAMEDIYWFRKALFGYPYGLYGEEVKFIKLGSAGLPLPGIDPVVLDETGKELPPNEKGILYN